MIPCDWGKGETALMPKIALRATTGDARIDDVVRGVVAAFEDVFPGRMRAHYVVGSQADGTATPVSDVDMYVLFKDDLAGQEERRAAEQIRRMCATSPVALDIVVKGERVSIGFGEVDLKLRSLLVFGEDMRDRIPFIPVEVGARGSMHFHHSFLARTRGNVSVLTFPLKAPDPSGDFLGYDRRRMRATDGTEHATTRDLVRSVLGAASALVAWRAGQYVPHKGAAPSMYRRYVADDGWADFLDEVDRHCRLEWGYLVPSGATERHLLRSLCEAAIDFENRFLSAYREMLLADLRDTRDFQVWLPVTLAHLVLGGMMTDMRRSIEAGDLLVSHSRGYAAVPIHRFPTVFAARMAARVRYPDGEVERALRHLVDASDSGVRQAAKTALQELTRR